MHLSRCNVDGNTFYCYTVKCHVKLLDVKQSYKGNRLNAGPSETHDLLLRKGNRNSNSRFPRNQIQQPRGR